MQAILCYDLTTRCCACTQNLCCQGQPFFLRQMGILTLSAWQLSASQHQRIAGCRLVCVLNCHLVATKGRF